MWSSMFVLLAMEAALVLVTASAGAFEFFLQEASESLGSLMRS